MEILLAFWLLPPTASLCKALRYQYVHFNSIGVSWVVSLYFLFENILGLRAILNSFLLVAKILPHGIGVTIKYFFISCPAHLAMSFSLLFIFGNSNHTLGIGSGIMLFSCYYSIGRKRKLLVYYNYSHKEGKIGKNK